MFFSAKFLGIIKSPYFQVPFVSVWQALIKTSVMMIGEFEYDAIFNGDKTTHQGTIYQETAAYILFVVFMILMSIIVMNLLVGLAVDDIKAVQEQAALKRMAMQVCLIQWSLTYPDPTYPDTCLGTNYDYILESVSFIQIFSYLDCHLGNGGVRVCEAPLYLINCFHTRPSL